MLGIHFLLQSRRQANRSHWLAWARKQKNDAKRTERIALKRAETLENIDPRIGEIEQLIASRNLRFSSRRCPECQELMGRATCQGLEIDCCYRCLGIWLDAGELQQLTELEQDIPDNEMASRPSPRACPVCGKPMTEKVFLPPYNLLVDVCEAGHGVYLQEGELRRVFELI